MAALPSENIMLMVAMLGLLQQVALSLLQMIVLTHRMMVLRVRFLSIGSHYFLRLSSQKAAVNTTFKMAARVELTLMRHIPELLGQMARAPLRALTNLSRTHGIGQLATRQ